MKCPHCLVSFHENILETPIGSDADGNFEIQSTTCPSCQKIIFTLVNWEYSVYQQIVIKSSTLIRPKGISRQAVPLEVPKKFADDYIEACLVLAESSKASAALSRRCLQNVIHDQLKIKGKDLYSEIQEVIDKQMLPSDILESIDAVRAIGNFAAHPIKSTSSGEIVEVGPHEAEWNLDVLEMIFDNLFVAPALVKKKKDAFNVKLGGAGKPLIK